MTIVAGLARGRRPCACGARGTPRRTARAAPGRAGSAAGRRRGRRRAAPPAAVIARGSPSSVRSATPRRSRMSAARRIRSSSPSGSTMWRRSATARSMQLVLEHQRRHRVGAGHLEPVEQRVAVDVLVEQRQGGGDLAGRALVEPAADRWSAPTSSRGCRGRWRRSASSRRGPSISRAHLLGQREAAVEHDAGDLREVRGHVGGEHPEHDLGPVARRDHDRRPRRAGRARCGIVIAATTKPVASRASSDASPLTSVPSQAAIRSATEGALSSGSSGRAKAGTPARSSASTSVDRPAARRPGWRRPRTACRGWR